MLLKGINVLIDHVNYLYINFSSSTLKYVSLGKLMKAIVIEKGGKEGEKKDGRKFWVAISLGIR